MKPIDFWSEFTSKNPEYRNREMPPSFYFCDNEQDANECAELVKKSIKQATAPSLWWFEQNNEELPKPGDMAIVTDWTGQAVTIIKTTKVELKPFKEIDETFAAIEGEGDKSLDYWQKAHRAYYSREMATYNEEFSEDMMIVCEYFETIFNNNSY